MALTEKEKDQLKLYAEVPDGRTTVQDALDKIDDVTATAAELNILAGVTATAAELNLLDASNTEPADGAWAGLLRVAKVEYDFATDGGAIGAIDLGVTIPDNALILGGFVDVITTCTSATDAGTGALHIQSADDMVAAVAINNGANPWDAGKHAIVPDLSDISTAVQTTAARAITFTIAAEAFTAGKFNAYFYYVICE